jgi:hypothetical protein
VKTELVAVDDIVRKVTLVQLSLLRFWFNIKVILVQSHEGNRFSMHVERQPGKIGLQETPPATRYCKLRGRDVGKVRGWWPSAVLPSFSVKLKEPLVLLEDNQSTILFC